MSSSSRCDHPETFIHDQLPVALHGQGFARRDVTDDLAASYPSAIPGHVNIGVLHGTLTGSQEHERYAPTSLNVLRRHHYDYWALGHVHQAGAEPLSRQPYVTYSGNLQGRNIRETGAKGCLVVEIGPHDAPRVEFVATDVLRWAHCRVVAESDDHLPEIEQRIREALTRCQHEADGRYCAVRLEVAGTCHAHQDLRDQGHREVVAAQWRDLANHLGNVWIEKIVIRTAPAWDLDALRQAGDMLGELLRRTHGIVEQVDQWDTVFEPLGVLADRIPRELRDAGVDLREEAVRRRWLEQAEILLASELVEGGE